MYEIARIQKEVISVLHHCHEIHAFIVTTMSADKTESKCFHYLPMQASGTSKAGALESATQELISHT